MNPPKIHITVPRGFRVRRAVPGHLAIHHADLSDNDVKTPASFRGWFCHEQAEKPPHSARVLTQWVDAYGSMTSW